MASLTYRNITEDRHLNIEPHLINANSLYIH